VKEGMRETEVFSMFVKADTFQKKKEISGMKTKKHMHEKMKKKKGI
jgi:hypothetical protein